MTKLYEALKVGGRLRSQDGKLGSVDGQEKTEAILAGLIIDSDGLKKPDTGGSQTVQLRFGKKKANANGAVPVNADGSVPLNFKRKSSTFDSAPIVPAQTNGVGFVDFSDDLDEMITGEDDELIDEDDLLTEEDLARPIVQRKLCIIFSKLGHLLTTNSTRMSTKTWKTSSSMQGLLLWSKREDRSRGCSEAGASGQRS